MSILKNAVLIRSADKGEIRIEVDEIWTFSHFDFTTLSRCRKINESGTSRLAKTCFKI